MLKLIHLYGCNGLTMINANFTETIGGISVAGKTLPVYEVRVEKGCGTKSEFMKNVKKGNLCKITLYNQTFWIANLKVIHFLYSL